MINTLKSHHSIRRFDPTALAVAIAGLAICVGYNVWALSPYVAGAFLIVRLP